MILGFDISAIVWTGVAVVLLFAAVVGILRLIENNAQRSLEALHLGQAHKAELEALRREMGAKIEALRDDVDDLELNVFGGGEMPEDDHRRPHPLYAPGGPGPRPGGEDDPTAGFDDFGKSYEGDDR